MLEIRSLSLRFGGLAVLRDVGFTAHDGEVTALIGPNGAGKSALLNCISGLYPASPDARILVDGKSLGSLPAHRRAAAGVARTFQHVNLVPELSVLENLMSGLTPTLGDGLLSTLARPWRQAHREAQRRELAHAALEKFELAHVAHMKPTQLPLGVQRRIDVARATMCEPSVLLLDEPASGMSRAERSSIPGWIRALQQRTRGVVIWIEHDIDLLLSVADAVVVLHHGEVVATGRPRENAGDRQLVASAYFGRAAA